MRYADDPNGAEGGLHDSLRGGYPKWLRTFDTRELAVQMTGATYVLCPLAIVVGSCAGRDPQPIATVQSTDTHASCAQIQGEIEANNIKVQELANEKGAKVGQNVTAGVVGLVLWPVWFGMDFKGAAEKEAAALQARQQYLTTLAGERCAAPPQRRP